MLEHPINGMLNRAMENLKEMVDVNTIVGNPIETENLPFISADVI